MQNAEQRQNEIPEWFLTRLTALFLLHPNTVQKQGTSLSWWQFLRDLPEPAILVAFDRAPKENAQPQWVPSAETVRQIAEQEAKRMVALQRETRRERLLAAPAQDHDRKVVLDGFYATCDRALSRVREATEINNQVEPDIEGVFLAMMRCYSPTLSEEDRGIVGPVLNHFRVFRKYTPSAVVHGLRKAPVVCRKSPTIGMLDELIRGQAMIGWPDDWVDRDEAAKMVGAREHYRHDASRSVASVVGDLAGSMNMGEQQ
jgi:phosphopantetheine adenylyltransferase